MRCSSTTTSIITRRASRTSDTRSNRRARRSRSSEPRGEAIERATHFIETPDVVGIDGRDAEALATGLDDEPLSVQEVEGVADGLARHAKFVGEFTLANSETWR